MGDTLEPTASAPALSAPVHDRAAEAKELLARAGEVGHSELIRHAICGLAYERRQAQKLAAAKDLPPTQGPAPNTGSLSLVLGGCTRTLG
jgi:hypothetical protein